MDLKLHLWWRRVSLLILLALLLQGCRTLSSDTPTTGSPASPQWDELDIARSIDFLKRHTGRQTGMVDYLFARFTQFNLQPITYRSFAIAYALPKNDSQSKPTENVEGERRPNPTDIERRNIFGFIAGKDPKLRQELVVVGVNLKPGSGQDRRRTIATAALIELARHYEFISSKLPLPDRTILFAGWTGDRHFGLRSFIRNPMWPVDQIRRVIFLEPDESDAAEIASILDAAHIESDRVSFGDFGVFRSTMGEAPPDSLHLADVSPERFPEMSKKDVETSMAMAISLAANRIILREAISPDLPTPVFDGAKDVVTDSLEMQKK